MWKYKLNITVQLELGIQVDDDDEYMMLLDPIPDYRGSWVRLYNILYSINGVVRKRVKEWRYKLNITVQLELGIQVDNDEEYIMLLDPIPDYRGSWVRVYNILYCINGVERKRVKEWMKI